MTQAEGRAPQRAFSPASERNKAPILAVLEGYVSDGIQVLEVGTGTGQHAVHFAAALPGLRWLTSDLAANHPGICAWIEEAALPNLESPVTLDTRAEAWPLDSPVDIVYSANTAHIMSVDAVEGMFNGAGRWLKPGGKMLLYGPFRFAGEHSSVGNQHFDASLRAQDSAMGIRDMDDLNMMAASAGLSPLRLHAMPANNFISVWQREC